MDAVMPTPADGRADEFDTTEVTGCSLVVAVATVAAGLALFGIAAFGVLVLRVAGA